MLMQNLEEQTKIIMIFSEVVYFVVRSQSPKSTSRDPTIRLSASELSLTALIPAVKTSKQMLYSVSTMVFQIFDTFNNTGIIIKLCN